MAFSRGARVHVPGLGTGVVLEPRGGNRYAIDIKGRVVVADARHVQPADESTRSRQRRTSADAASPPPSASAASSAPSIDLHGKTTLEAVDLIQAFINDALLDGHAEVRIIHGSGSGKVKAAVHTCLRGLAPVRSFRLDPRNRGVTIVVFN
jgi:DNA mismatch repair protein MutS2